MSSGQTHFEHGLARLRDGDIAAGAAALEAAVALMPEHAEARYRLGNAYCDLFRLSDAERELRTVMRLRPDDPRPHSALGIVLLESGRGREALAAHEEAVRLGPTNATVATNWLMAQQYVEGVTEAQLLESHRRCVALQGTTDAPVTITDPNPDRPLNVGFVTSEFARHPVGRLSVRLFENLDPTRIRAHVFSTRPPVLEDDLSRRIAGTTRWTTVYGLSDEALAAYIRGAKIDILFDTSGHTGHNRLSMFARRAAPVQVNWLGYAGTTGVPAMDYILATEALAPPGTEAFWTERAIRLPTHACFDPPPDAPPVSSGPAASNGFVTFGCLNNPAKMSQDTLSSFAAIMARVPGSRLKLRYRILDAAEVRERLYAALEERGIARARVDIAGSAPGNEFLATYNEIDIALDTQPFSGCMTTCEALWMGCPVVTYMGATAAGRQSASILHAAGLNDLIAGDRAAFETLAVRLAADADRRAALRAGLRAQVAGSPLCDGAAFARAFESAMRDIWRPRCAENK